MSRRKKKYQSVKAVKKAAVPAVKVTAEPVTAVKPASVPDTRFVNLKTDDAGEDKQRAAESAEIKRKLKQACLEAGL